MSHIILCTVNEPIVRCAEDGYKRWYAIAHNYILSMSSTRMLYIMGDANIDHPLCVAVSYMYPEDTVESEYACYASVCCRAS